MMFGWKKVMLNSSFMDANSRLKNITIKYLFKKTWGSKRELPKIQAKSFNKLWKKRYK